jgi:hypothetical protein
MVPPKPETSTDGGIVVGSVRSPQKSAAVHPDGTGTGEVCPAKDGHAVPGTLIVTLAIAGPDTVRIQQAKPIVNNCFTFHLPFSQI